MGGFFGISSHSDCMYDVFYGTDYHSHLGTYTGGLAAYDAEVGLQRRIHHINHVPFRSKFENVFDEMKGTSVIGCISDTSPQPIVVRSRLGSYAICFIGVITNEEQVLEDYLAHNQGHFDAMTSGKVNPVELLAALIDTKDDFAEGIAYAQSLIEGTASILILKDDGHIIAARDAVGRLPILVGKSEDAYAVTFESFVFGKLGFDTCKELGPGEIVELSPDGITVLREPGEKMRMCSFLWSYYGYPTSTYEGVNVELMRNRNGAIMARDEAARGLMPEGLDSVAGVPDSGVPHGIGYANGSGVPYARPFIKYTPTWQRSFMPTVQSERSRVAKMKQIPVTELIEDKRLLFVDDSIVRGTQLRETVKFLFDNGAEEVHMRSACPPIMYSCKYLNFSRSTSDMELLGRRIIMELEGEEGFDHIEEYSDGTTERGRALRRAICEKMNFTSLEFQSLEGLIEAIGIEPCKLCTYCWNGRE